MNITEVLDLDVDTVVSTKIDCEVVSFIVDKDEVGCKNLFIINSQRAKGMLLTQAYPLKTILAMDFTKELPLDCMKRYTFQEALEQDKDWISIGFEGAYLNISYILQYINRKDETLTAMLRSIGLTLQDVKIKFFTFKEAVNILFTICNENELKDVLQTNNNFICKRIYGSSRLFNAKEAKEKDDNKNE